MYREGRPADPYRPDVPTDPYLRPRPADPYRREPFADPRQPMAQDAAGTAFGAGAHGPEGPEHPAVSRGFQGPARPDLYPRAATPPRAWDAPAPPDRSGPLPQQVPAAIRQAVPADPYRWPPSSGPQQVQHGGQLAPGPVLPGPLEISAPTRVTPWPDHPAISGSVPTVQAGPVAPDGFDDYEAGQHLDDGYADEEDPQDAYGWADDDSGPIVPMDPAGRSRRGGGRPRRRGRRRIAPLIALLVLAVFLSGGGIAGYHFLRAYVIPPDYSGPGYGTVVVQVKPGQTATDVASTLVRLGVIASTRAFVKAAEQSSRPTALEPGFYRLHRHMKAALAFDLLLAPGSRIQTKITIPEGLRVSQIIATLGAKSGLSAAAYQTVLAHPASLGLPSYAKNQPEGYLFPATYPVQPGMTASQVLRAMVTRFNSEAAKINLVAVAEKVNLTPSEAIIVASLVQAEGGRVSDFAKIARVIYNRLDSGMPLELDSTVMYALHTYGILATNQQLQVRSPYNTYLNTGLPPGPIDSPGDAAIQAALHPAVGDWLYFVTVNPHTGQTEFTASAARFAQLKAELERNLGR